MPTPVPSTPLLPEAQRLAALRTYGITSETEDAALNDLTALAAAICEAPIAIITIVETDRQLFLAKYGIEGEGTPRAHAFCDHAIRGRDLFFVEDAAEDPRFSRNPLVTGDPNIRFYAGMPLIDADGAALGSVCIIDRRPRALRTNERQALRVLRDFVMAHLALQRQNRMLELAQRRYRDLVENSLGLICTHDLRGVLTLVNPAAAAALGFFPEEMVGRPLTDFMRGDDVPLILGYLDRLRATRMDEGMLPVVDARGRGRVWRYRSVVTARGDGTDEVIGHALDVTDELARAERS